MQQVMVDDIEIHSVESPDDFLSVKEAALSEKDGANIYELIEKRGENRSSGRRDVLVVLGAWALDSQYGPISESKYLFVNTVEDYSEKAYVTTKAFYVDKMALRNDESMNAVLTKIDERDDGAPKKGVKFLPKSAVEAIFDPQKPTDADGFM